MAICSFFLQGRCRYGEKCWNEHPRGGSSRYQSQNRYQEPPGNAKGTWGSSSQRYVQPSSFSRSTTWVNRDNEKPSSGSHSGFDNRNVKFTAATGFPSSQNRFAALSSQDNSRDAQTDKGNIIDDITNDMEIWESSGQWMFSVYSMLREKKNISGFADFSPEELRLEYYACQAEGNPLKYINAVQQLGSKWKQRILELKNLNPSSKMALVSLQTTQPQQQPHSALRQMQQMLLKLVQQIP